MIRHMFKIVWNRKSANALIILEIFCSFLVVFAVAATAISSWRNYHRPLGYEWRDVWHVQFRVSANEQLDAAAISAANAKVERLLRELESMDPVQRAAAGHYPPYSQSTWSMGWTDSTGQQRFAEAILATPGFHQVLGIEFVAGRWFEAADAALHWKPVVVNQRLATELFGSEDPLGQAIDFGAREEGDAVPKKRVIGVIRDYRKSGELSAAGNILVEAAWLDGAERPMSHLVVKMAPGTTAAFEETLVKRLQAVAPEFSFRVRSLASKRDAYLRLRFAPLLAAGVVAGFLMIMVALGLVGVLWQNVTQRTLEIGLRRAKGATRPDIHWQILGEMLTIATLGLAAGSLVVAQMPILGWFGSLEMETYGLAFGVSVVGIYFLATLCGLYPGWLAARIQPAEALHYE